jgi:hypothetical protein
MRLELVEELMTGVGLGVGVGVGLGDGFGVGLGDGFALADGFGVGLGDGVWVIIIKGPDDDPPHPPATNVRAETPTNNKANRLPNRMPRSSFAITAYNSLSPFEGLMEGLLHLAATSIS